MIAKADLIYNHQQYTKAGINCEVIESNIKYTTFKRPVVLKEKPRQRKYSKFRVANYLLPLYFHTGGNHEKT